jgi:hypothetical protein
LPNIVRVGQQLQWIDFREARFECQVNSCFVKDMRILVASFVQLSSTALVGKLNVAVSGYVPSNKETISNICQALKEKLFNDKK